MSLLMGNKIRNLNVQPIETIMRENRNIDVVTITGTIIQLAIKGPYDDGRRLYDGSIYDGTSSMFFRFYAEELFDLNEGMGIRIQGAVRFHQGKKELSVYVNNLETAEIPKKEVSDGNVDTPRVEFQTFSFMTEKRGAVPVKRYFERAKALGHKAVAVTDLGVSQAFPDAFQASKKTGVKAIYGMTAYMVENKPVVYGEADGSLDDSTYVVFDVETTGFSARHDELTEIGASKVVNGVVTERFGTFVKGNKPVPATVVELTGITDELRETGVSLEEAVEAFEAFASGSVLVAHNAWFDQHMIAAAYERVGKAFPAYAFLDTLKLSRILNQELKQHALGKLASHYGVQLNKAHRAVDDAHATAEVLIHLLRQAKEAGVSTVDGLNNLVAGPYHHHHYPNEVTIWVENQKGLKNLNTLISLSHTEQLSNLGSIDRSPKPMLTWDLLDAYREGLIVGSGSHFGSLFTNALEKPDAVVEEEIASGRYDVIEIQPADVVRHYWENDNPKADGEEAIIEAWKLIHSLAGKHQIPVIATGHAHYCEEEEALVHNILLYSALPPKQMSHERRRGRMEYPQGPCHFRTTEEMLASFPWLPQEEVHRIVVENTNALADRIEVVKPIPVDEDDNPILFAPKIDGIDEAFEQMAYENAHRMYGNPLPTLVKERLEKEIASITKHGFAVIYMITQEIVQQSLNDDYLVGSRGSVGSSLAATMTNITEVNPLQPHYLCSSCQFSIFFNHEELLSGYDLPTSFRDLLNDDRFGKDAQDHFLQTFVDVFHSTPERIREAFEKHEDHTCPKCKKKTLRGDGQDIPFETFLGFKGDKVPDIDLNFSGEYQSVAHQFVLDKFGEEFVYRAGTIGTVADKTAFAYARGYYENHGAVLSKAEYGRIASLLAGSKQSTGQHPGGMLVCPDYIDMTDIAPYQFPANSVIDKKTKKPSTKTSHLDFHSIHDNILKLDILGHDNPTQLRYAKDFTGVDPRDIPGADPLVLKLYNAPEEALGVHPDQFMAKTGTLGLPEMGTRVVQDVISETVPKTYGDLVTLSGLTHGTDVYYNNAQTLIQEGKATIRTVIGCRDDIMRTLILKGLEPSVAFKIMESVRKGKGLTPEWEETMKANGVPDYYIWSCKQIKYMFPKAHASAYVTDAMRMGYYKVYHPTEFYASVFSAKYNQENILNLTRDINQTRTMMEELTEGISQAEKDGETNKANKMKRTKTAVNLALEAKVRGVTFGPVRMYESHATKYLIDWEKNELIAPFSSIDGIGGSVAVRLHQERFNGAFKGIDDLQERTGVNKKVILSLRDMGCLDLIEETQRTFF